MPMVAVAVLTLTVKVVAPASVAPPLVPPKKLIVKARASVATVSVLVATPAEEAMFRVVKASLESVPAVATPVREMVEIRSVVEAPLVPESAIVAVADVPKMVTEVKLAEPVTVMLGVEPELLTVTVLASVSVEKSATTASVASTALAVCMMEKVSIPLMVVVVTGRVYASLDKSTMFNVSVPSPPLIESKAVSVSCVALNVSLPAVLVVPPVPAPTNEPGAVPDVSTPVVSVQ